LTDIAPPSDLHMEIAHGIEWDPFISMTLERRIVWTPGMMVLDEPDVPVEAGRIAIVPKLVRREYSKLTGRHEEVFRRPR
jgi:hypothetical protein